VRSTLALLPSLVVLIAVLGLRASGLSAAAAAACAAVAIWLAGPFATPAARNLLNAVADAGVLTALVAAMIVPGVVFVETSRRRKAPEAIAAVVDAISLSKPLQAILIAVGIGVAVESLTGMGVSLLITVPLLLRLVDREKAIGLALVGMCLMPFGALSISAHVGSKLAGLPIDELARWTVLVSAPVAFGLPLLCLLILRERKPTDVIGALLSGAAIVAGIALTALFAGIEIAGVIGGIAVIVVLAAMARQRSGLATALLAPGLRPYLVLIAMVALQKIVTAPLTRAGLSPALATDRVSFAILTSPGLALLAATVLTSARHLTGDVVAGVARRAWRPVLSVLLFMVSARLLVESGAIVALAGLLAGLGGAGAAVTVAALGALGGFVTGSGVTSSALFMPSAAAAGAGLGQLPLFAALQNSAGGHTGMSSLPVLAILLASLPSREPGDDARSMRKALALAGWHLVLVMVMGLVLLRLVA
jgi:lactate permease